MKSFLLCSNNVHLIHVVGPCFKILSVRVFPVRIKDNNAKISCLYFHTPLSKEHRKRNYFIIVAINEIGKTYSLKETHIPKASFTHITCVIVTIMC